MTNDSKFHGTFKNTFKSAYNVIIFLYFSIQLLGNFYLLYWRRIFIHKSLLRFYFPSCVNKHMNLHKRRPINTSQWKFLFINVSVNIKRYKDRIFCFGTRDKSIDANVCLRNTYEKSSVTDRVQTVCLIEPSTMGVRPHAERVPNLIEAPRPMAISCLTMTIKPRIFTQICISRYHKFSFRKNRDF